MSPCSNAPNPSLMFSLRAFALASLLALTGCASTQFETSGRIPPQPVCQARGETLSALILWGPQWRPNQKDVPDREAAAQRGIERFFASSGCFSKVHIIRTVDDRPAVALSPFEARALAAADSISPSRVIVITVRELGPIVRLLSSPALVEGGTEVVLEIRSVVATTGEVTADYRSHWRHGGPWFIKGVGTLEQDIGAALQAALKPQPSGS